MHTPCSCSRQDHSGSLSRTHSPQSVLRCWLALHTTQADVMRSATVRCQGQHFSKLAAMFYFQSAVMQQQACGLTVLEQAMVAIQYKVVQYSAHVIQHVSTGSMALQQRYSLVKPTGWLRSHSKRKPWACVQGLPT